MRWWVSRPRAHSYLADVGLGLGPCLAVSVPMASLVHKLAAENAMKRGMRLNPNSWRGRDKKPDTKGFHCGYDWIGRRKAVHKKGRRTEGADSVGDGRSRANVNLVGPGARL
eukprot:357179-Chlamydomonas_euryale.AAC.1